MQPRQQSVRRAVLQFALTGLAAVLLLGYIAVQVMQSVGEGEAIEDAKRVSALAGKGIVAPLLTDKVLRGDKAATRTLDEAIRKRLALGTAIVRVKVWDKHGRILYSDDHRLTGRKFRLADDDLEALETGKMAAEVSDLSKTENMYERKFHKLLEVYGGVDTQSGERVLFESYQPYKSIAASGRRAWIKFLPALVGALLLLELVQIPLAYLLARRLRERQRERTLLLQQALDASFSERRRIASDLHDGPVQDLAGVAFGLSAAASRLNGADRELQTAITDAAGTTRATMRDLRSTLVDLYPPALQRSGLSAPISDLLARLRANGVETSLSIPGDLRLPDSSEAVMFRAARELLANVRKHADAKHVDVTVAVEDGVGRLTIVDDGRGFHQEQLNERRQEGHVGLGLLTEFVREGGGTLTVESDPGQGTTVRVEVPA